MEVKLFNIMMIMITISVWLKPYSQPFSRPPMRNDAISHPLAGHNVLGRYRFACAELFVLKVVGSKKSYIISFHLFFFGASIISYHTA